MPLTLWGDLAQKEDFEKHCILLIKSVQVGEYNGNKQLSTSFSSLVLTDVSEYQAAEQLYDWFTNQDINEQFLHSGNKT